MKIVIILILLVIVFSLGSALYYLVTDREKSAKTVRALTWRVGLSIGLFFLLLMAFGSGLIKPHSFVGGIRHEAPKSAPSP